MSKIIPFLGTFFLAAGLAFAEPLAPSGGDDYAAITNAIALAGSGTAELGEGTFLISQTLVLTSAATLQGAGMDKTVIKPTKGGFCGLSLQNKDCMVCDLTVTGFTSSGELTAAGITVATGGVIRRCHITRNRSTGTLSGIGVCLSRNAGNNAYLYDSIVDFNTPGSETHSIEGGGIYSFRGTISGCLVVSNKANTAASGDYDTAGGGGGIATIQGKIISTTVADNNQGGIYFTVYGGDRPSALITNCVVSGNISGGRTGNYGPDIESYTNGYEPKFYDSFTGSAVTFADAAHGDYRLSVHSAGVTEGAGYSPYDTTTDALGFYTEKPRYVVGSNVVFKANLCGQYKGATCAWTISDGTNPDITLTGNPVTNRFTTAGTYSVTLTAGGKSVTRADMVRIVPAEVPLAVGESLAEALALAADGQVIALADGTHEVTRAVTLDCNVTVRGNGYAKCTLAKVGDVKDRVVRVCAKGAVLEGVTVTGGRANDFKYCWGGGVMVDGNGGTVRKCRITGNGFNAQGGRGGGVSITVPNGRVTHCIIDGNSAFYGGGAYMQCTGNGFIGDARLDTCLVIGNTATCGGGIGVNGSVNVRGCTTSGNTASSRGGGICHVGTSGGTSVINCLFSGDTADKEDVEGGKPEWSQFWAGNWVHMMTDAFSYCAFDTATKYGTGSVSVTKPFMDKDNGDYSLVASSPAKDAGTVYSGIPDTDLAGNPRIMGSAPDMGCYEYDTTKASCDFSASPTTVWVNEPVTLTPIVIGGSGTFNYSWVVTHENGAETYSHDEKPELTFAKGGKYSVSLVVSNETKEVARQAHSDVFQVYSRVVYVKPVSPKMEAPYDSWETAHTNILELMQRVTDGCTIMIGAGTNIVTNVVYVSQALTFRGEGMDKTWVRYDRSHKQQRVFHLNKAGAVVERLTVNNGNGGQAYEEWGGGVLIDANGGTLQDCRVTGNGAGSYYCKGVGVGVKGAKALVRRCIIDRNYGGSGHGTYGGLAVESGHVENCLVYSNQSHSAAGLYVYTRFGNGPATVSNCTFACNVAYSCGAGGIRIQHCTNYEVVNCIFAGNTGKALCNECAYSKGVLRSDRGQFDVNELDLFWGGGSNFASLQKCAEANRVYYHNCCFGFADLSLVFGTDCLNAMPQYLDMLNCDYRLKPTVGKWGDRAVNTGKYGAWMAGATDLDGKPRVKKVKNGNGLVDMGCYETRYIPVGMMLLIK